ncbi:MAG: anhydro-N-acetylmuramic acid kinase [Gammaproteobacteria bacterium]|jgi:anhydro-N-acetylmuramic acid kinase|nr:anhydro-N-acetylmuramic acid kinase [Gammaproteobacteria bacterium]
MSGTSMDAIDAALVEIKVQNVNVLAYEQFPIPNEIQNQVRNVNSATSIEEISELDAILGKLFADASLRLINSNNIDVDQICAIGSHGQTVLHMPEHNFPRTLQIGDANIIACQTGITTVADFRRMDMAAGGQGAPLASAFHAWYFRQSDKACAVLNIGGMANITLLPADPEKTVTGFDTGPGNALMDDWTQEHLGKDYDEDGDWAASGTVSERLLQALLQTPYFSAKPPKSTGKDDFNLQWLDQKLDEHGESVTIEDIQATLLELSAYSISDAINKLAPDSREILVCGGGIHNKQLMLRLKELLIEKEICSTEKYDIDPDALEAVVFAWLAKCRMENTAANLPSVTGASKKVLLGGVYKA